MLPGMAKYKLQIPGGGEGGGVSKGVKESVSWFGPAEFSFTRKGARLVSKQTQNCWWFTGSLVTQSTPTPSLSNEMLK